MTESVSMDTVEYLLADLRELVSALDGEGLNANVPNHKTLMANKAKVSTDLQYAAHLARLVEVEIMNQFYRFKGREDVPSVDAG